MVTPTCGHFTVQLPNLGKISYRPCKYKGIMMHSLVTVQYQSSYAGLSHPVLKVRK